MRVIIKMTSEKVKVFSYIPIKKNMRGIGQKVKNMDLENNFIVMVIFMKDIGLKILNQDTEFLKLVKIKLFIKEIGKIINMMEKENYS